jgi:hypothetical protein
MHFNHSFADPESRISIATIMLATVFQVMVVGSLLTGFAN